MSGAKKSQTVLVVDDDPRIVRFIRISLMAHGYGALVACDGEEALSVVRASRPDVMVLDIVLPEKDGLMVLEELRGFSSMPVVAMSAEPSLGVKALRLGANDFIGKPFTPEDLVGRIEAALGHGSLGHR